MIPKKVLQFEYAELVNWLRYEAGSSNADYFKALEKKEGSLKLQQNPNEYASLLLLMKSHGAKSYLELGVGNGGSFAMACFMMCETLLRADAVDCLAYRNLGIGQCEEEINMFVDYAKTIKSVISEVGQTFSSIPVTFSNETTDVFFSKIGDNKYHDIYYDIIFIDADHSYEGVRKDFVNAQKHINEGGLIIFHDIASKACPGIVKIWSEIKAQAEDRCTEFIHGENCGIGVLRC